MTNETFKKADNLKLEIKFIKTEILPPLNRLYNEVISYRDMGYKETDGSFYIKRYFDDFFKVNLGGNWTSATFTIENIIYFLETEIKTVTEHKENLEKELEEL